MTSPWLLIALLAAVAFLIKAIGPATLGSRSLPPQLTGVVVLLSPALLAALVLTSALADGESWNAGADTVGVGVAGLLLWRKAPVLVVVLGAALTTAVLRRVGLD